MMGWLARSWQLVAALASGIAAAALMPDAFYGEAVSEVVTVLGFLMAAFVPAMALAATFIRAGSLSVRSIRLVAAAVKVQIEVFGGLFFYSLTACVVLISGKLLHWSLPVIPVRIAGQTTINTAFFFPGSLTFLFVFLILRSGTFVTGMLSILRITTASAEDEARFRDAAREVESADELESYDMPTDYGKLLKE